MLFIFSTPVLMRHLWQLKAVVFMHRCLIRYVLMTLISEKIDPFSQPSLTFAGWNVHLKMLRTNRP